LAEDVAYSEDNPTVKFQIDAPEFEPSERRTRTALKTSALEFKPQMPFVPMAAVENAWQQWHAAQLLMHAAMVPAMVASSFDLRGNGKQIKQSRRRRTA